MQFNQISGAPMLYAADSANGTLLYLMPQNTSYPARPITFAESWSKYAGWYIFLNQALHSGTGAAFAGEAWEFLAPAQMQSMRFVWFNPPDGSGILTGTTLGVLAAGNAFQTFPAATFAFNNLSVFVSGGTPFQPDPDNFAFILTQTSLQAMVLNNQSGNPGIPVVSTLTIPLTGSMAGCLQFAVNLTGQNLTDLDIGLRFFYAIPADIDNPDAPATDFQLGSLQYPVFNQGMTLYGSMDPLAPLTGTRTFFAFNGADAGQSGAAAAVGCNYTSILGDAFTLLPFSGAAAPRQFAALVLQINQQGSSLSGADPYYLAPWGDFALQCTRLGTVNLMCGLSGVEYIALVNPSAGNTGNILSFFPGSNAYAEGFNPQLKPGHPKLTPQDVPSTSFATVAQSAETLHYFAQPDQSVLYNHPEATQMLAVDPLQVEAATLPWPWANAKPAPPVFPFLPYSGALNGLDLNAYSQLETQVANPARRAVLAAQAGLPGPTAIVTTPSVTPQGLLVEYFTPFTGNPVWQSVVLAQMQQLVGGNLESAQLALTKVMDNLLMAFESNQLFLVVSNPAAFQELTSPQIYIGAATGEQWNFDITPNANWTQLNTIVIVKFADLALKDLASQTTTWAFPGTFNTAPASTSKAIGQIIQAAADSQDPDFATFLNAVSEPTWNGILILNAHAPLNSLPAQLAGLASGIDASKFFAHHVGVNASQIVNHGGVLGIDNSSIFGLINYTSPEPAPGSADYLFNVEQLKVLFLNSGVAGFSSRISLQINRLFGEACTQRNSPGNNNIVMYGVYQQQMVNGVPQDSYSFQTANGLTSYFDMQSKVLKTVALTKGQFVTITSSSDATETKSQFAFWGLLDFRALKNFDLFSFGSEDGALTTGLNFANLAIEMELIQATGKTDYTFDVSTLTFDLAGSAYRTGSFFNHFPLTLAGFTQAKEGVTPATAGYMGVQSPLNQSMLAYPWFSLNFNLNLGTPGALAADVGFVASLTAAWSPGTGSSYTVFTGLKLPGSNGAKKQISIEGIFNINFKTLEIIAVPASNTYILVLYGIAFSFLSFNFPPTGQVNFVLFGNPNPTPGDTTLGWYLAYAKPGTSNSGGGGSAQALTGAPKPVALLSSPALSSPALSGPAQ